MPRQELLDKITLEGSLKVYSKKLVTQALGKEHPDRVTEIIEEQRKLIEQFEPTEKIDELRTLVKILERRAAELDMARIRYDTGFFDDLRIVRLSR